MGILSIEEIREKLSDRIILIVAERTGVHHNVIYRIQKGESLPRYSTLIKLSNYLQGDDNNDGLDEISGRPIQATGRKKGSTA